MEKARQGKNKLSWEGREEKKGNEFTGDRMVVPGTPLSHYPTRGL
jgi:hypothetical protein